MYDVEKKQPGTKVRIDSKEFSRIKESVKYMKLAQKEKNGEVHLPIDLGLFVTGKCNLRCKHCFEWNDNGFLSNGDKAYANGEMPIEHIKECLEYTKPVKSRLFIWGGEPLLYSKFSELCQLLEEDKRWVTMCTNGMLIEDKLEDILPISENLVLLVSVDGFEECHEGIRGKGTFKRTMENIKKVTALIRKGDYKGKISVNCVISNEMIGRLHDFCELMEEVGIDTLYICFPWYISEETACEMDRFAKENFSDLVQVENYEEASWHDFSYHLDNNLLPELKEDLKHIIEKEWRIRVRFQPALELDEVEDFIQGGMKCAQGRKKCFANVNRLDILQNGEFSVCKLFKEFSVGNLRDSRVNEIWEGERINEFRKRMNCGLMPICSKCVLLYLNGV